MAETERPGAKTSAWTPGIGSARNPRPISVLWYVLLHSRLYCLHFDTELSALHLETKADRASGDIYRLLQIVPFHDPTTPPQFSKSDVPSSHENPFHITYNVWKPNTPFKKTAPGPPDFYISVVNARETSLPTQSQLNDLLATVPYDPPKTDGNLYQKLKHGYRNVVLAVVDQGVTSYLRLADAGFGMEKLYDRPPRGRGGKRGGFRGRGRGRGR